MESENTETFSFFSQEELRDVRYVNDIENILSKYDIISNETELLNNTSRNSIHIVEYVSNLIHNKAQIPQDILALFSKNYPFIENLNDYLEKKLLNLTKNDSTYFFRDITIIVNLFTISVKNEVFISYYHYNFENLSKLFRHLEKELIEIKDEDLFKLKFDSYVILLKSLTQLCVVNSTDIKRRENSKIFMDLMTESSNILKFKIKLNESQLNTLNHIQGTHLYYFIHIYSHTLDKDNLAHSLKIYYNAIERLEDGYYLSKNSDFIGDKEEEKYKEFLIFKNNCSILILELFSKLEELNISIDYIKENDDFRRILKTYMKNFNYVLKSEFVLEDLHLLKEQLLNSLTYEYKTDNDYIKEINYRTILNDFIILEKDFKNSNLKTIYQILLYGENFKAFKYLHIAKILATTEKIKNDYYEFYKLQILNLITYKINSFKIDENVYEVLDDIFKYINKNKTNSHLFSSYTQIYLNLALLYSKDKEKIKQAKLIYSLFLSTNKEHNNTTLEEIFTNISFYEPNITSSEDCLKEFTSTFKRDFDTKYQQLFNKVLEDDLIQVFDINEDISQLIQNKIFYGLCDVQISHSDNIIDELEDTGFKEFIIALESNFSVKLTYPIIQEEMVLPILEKNKDDLCYKLDNLFSHSDKDSEKFFDSVTDLYNIKKLEQILDNWDKEKVGFIQISLKNLDDYDINLKDKLLRTISNKIKEISKEEIGTFRLDGLKIGILTQGIRNKDYLLDDLREITVIIEGKEIQINPEIDFLIDKKENILFTSSENIYKTFFDME